MGSSKRSTERTGGILEVAPEPESNPAQCGGAQQIELIQRDRTMAAGKAPAHGRLLARRNDPAIPGGHQEQGELE